jgi:hypothetical protein
MWAAEVKEWMPLAFQEVSMVALFKKAVEAYLASAAKYGEMAHFGFY